MALLICMLCTLALLVGAKESALLNKAITLLNVCCISFIIILGSTHVSRSNWETDAMVPYYTNSTNSSSHIAYTNNAPSACSGSLRGFAPCGFAGILLGAVKVIVETTSPIFSQNIY